MTEVPGVDLQHRDRIGVRVVEELDAERGVVQADLLDDPARQVLQPLLDRLGQPRGVLVAEERRALRIVDGVEHPVHVDLALIDVALGSDLVAGERLLRQAGPPADLRDLLR